MASYLMGAILGQSTATKPRSTSWLDGLRGAAAFLVTMSHWNETWLSPFARGQFGAVVLNDRNVDGVWYFHKDDQLWAPWRIPIVHLLFDSGGAQVAVFFIISGFVLTWGPLGHLHPGQISSLHRSVSSSLFRRWSRLFLPCIIVTTLYLMRSIITEYQGLPWVFGQVFTYIRMAMDFANPFIDIYSTGRVPIYAYNVVLWTIPIEFKGSLFVYTLLVGLSRIKNFTARFSTTVAIALSALLVGETNSWLFGSGMALADYVRHRGGFCNLSQSKNVLNTALWILCLIFGLYLMDFVNESEWTTRPAYGLLISVLNSLGLSHLTIAVRVWWGLGALMVIVSASHLGGVRRFFEHAIMQYLGKVSFMLYLTHAFIGRIIADPLRTRIVATYPTEYMEDFDSEVYRTTSINHIFTYVLLFVLTVPAALTLAHVLEKYVDRPITALGRWMDRGVEDGFSTDEPLFAQYRALG